MRNKSNDANTRISKFLSLVLRHSPSTIHLNMDKNGWVDVNELIDKANKYKNMRLNIEILKVVVETNDKQRFKISEDEKMIRANQGHSINIDLELESTKPPDILYHGTASHLIDSIMKDGLKPMSRQYVHLSRTEAIALNVGERHGNPIVLYIAAKDMYEAGYKFYLSENNVWLVDEVSTEYINIKKRNPAVPDCVP